MADDIETELDAQLASQREALAGIDEVINLGGDIADEGHAELLQMREELRAAVSELEAALLEVKRERILNQLAAHNPPGTIDQSITDATPPLPSQAVLPATASPSLAPVAAAQPAAGSSCHFRYMDGRWYAGRIQGPGRQAGTLSVGFEIPTRPFMLDPVDVMGALVRPCPNPAVAASDAAVAPSRGYERGAVLLQGKRPLPATQVAPQQPPQQPPDGDAAVVHGADLALGRRALAQLPGSRLYVPVEVVALDVPRATATVLPLLPQGRGGGGSSGAAGGKVVVPLALVTRHAHVPAPPPVPPAVGATSGGDEGDSDDDGSSSSSGRSLGGSSSRSSSVSALLRPGGVGVAESGDEEEEEEEDRDDVYGDAHGDDDDDDMDMDLYDSEDDSGGGGGRRSVTFSKARGCGRGGGGGLVATGGGEDDDDDGGGGGSGDHWEEERESGGRGLDVFAHARLAAASGSLDDTARLAEWEAHSRGVASRLLVRMGYVRGRGLGSQGQGSVTAPEVLLLPERKGLGAVARERLRRIGGGGGGDGGKLQGGVDKGRRSKRGGARQKRKRAIIAAREGRQEAREAEEGVPGGGGLFDFINSSLGDSSAAARIRKAQVSLAGLEAGAVAAAVGGSDGPDASGAVTQRAGAVAIANAVAAASGGRAVRRPPDRRGLMTHHDNVAGIQAKLSRLHEMLGRHKDNRGLRTQIEAQIRAIQAELAAAQAAAARASKAIHDKDAQKKWLKF